jgi:hypothetical protein
MHTRRRIMAGLVYYLYTTVSMYLQRKEFYVPNTAISSLKCKLTNCGKERGVN